MKQLLTELPSRDWKGRVERYIRSQAALLRVYSACQNMRRVVGNPLPRVGTYFRSVWLDPFGDPFVVGLLRFWNDRARPTFDFSLRKCMYIYIERERKKLSAQEG